ncbi:conserved hypothetical protein [Leishmania major strain Friedlin]|uniref:Uncharacterized protein n=1 Tax=Leishmania major TaxID=5664 RepID=E9AEN6_LEIMA|nr:conserved hypothetical protein [Leishmania major strain Friedlin]CAG9582412.1 hypothetical_protein_-_conserved [Leishmania major strain Friedlin]CBZ12689.1 conserved hypothetical protein [Leishmania major strain Friedlin]|eukprot:XP_003722456.1 conserved hypothetical protein [Leishmania major strain Friedlin]
MESSISEQHHVLACATTLHVTLLTSHYAEASQRDDAAAASSNNAAAGHRREAPPSMKASSSTTHTKVAGSEEVEVYSCSSAVEQLDTVARVLCTILRQQSSASKGGVADAARRIQMAKAVRDNAVPWFKVAAAAAAAQGDEPHDHCLPRHSSESPGDSYLSLAPTLSVTAPSLCAAGAKEGGAQRPAGGNGHRNTPQQQRQSSVRLSTSRSSMHSSSMFSGMQRHMNEMEQEQRQFYLAKELPPCELVMIPGETPASAPSCVIFVYRLAHEEDVLAELSALSAAEQSSSAEKMDAPAADSVEPSGREKRDTCVFQAAAIVTRALWSTIRPILRNHLHATSSSVIPAHVPVVWAMADPRMVSGFLPYTSNDADHVFSPYACPAPVSPSSIRSPDETAAVERWVRLVPRTAFYLYDPSASSAAVQDTLAVLQAHLAKWTYSQASSPRAPRPFSSGDTKKPMPPQRGGGSSQTGAATKATRANGPAPSGSRGSKGRSGRGAAGAAGAAAGNTSALAPSAPHQTALQSRQLSMGIDLQATPAEFPYCTTNPRSLAYYLYARGVASAPSPPQVAALAAPSPSPAGLEGELTSYLSKMAAFQQAVVTVSEADMPGSATEGAFERMWCAHAPLLRWVHAYLSDSVASTATSGSAVEQVSSGADGDPRAGHQRPSVALEKAVHLSLSRRLPDDSRWPLPLWKVAALPIAPVPPLTLLCRGPDDAATSTSAATDSVAQWAAAVLSVVVDYGKTVGGTEGNSKTPLMPLLSRLVRLIDAYNGWSLNNSLTPARGARSDGRNGTRVAAAEKAAGDYSVDASAAVQRSIASACCTGGVFNIMSAVCAWMATVSESLLLQKPSCELTALCATPESPVSRSAGGHLVSDAATAMSIPPSGLFRRYAQPFQKLSVPSSGGAKALMNAGTLAATVPRLPKTTETRASDSAAAAAPEGKRCAVTTSARVHHHNADVVLPPYPQEVLWMIRHVIAKNTGHFEVNVARGTDTVTPTVARTGLPPSMLDLATGGSSSLATRQSTMATMTIATPSTGLFLQQQRRRLRWQTSGVATKLQPYLQGVHLIKEMARNLLGRRPLAEAAVALQEALESTLAAPQCEVAAGEGRGGSVSARSHQSRKKHCGGSAEASTTGTEQVSALDLLQRYLVSVDPMQAHLSTKSKPVALQRPALVPELHPSKENSESEMLATRAAAENLMPRIYEHTLQQAFLYQLLRETKLESTRHSASLPSYGHTSTAAREEAVCEDDDWSVTQQLPVQAIAASIVNFQERFGAHNVVWRSCALHYRPLQSPTPTAAGSAGRGIDAVASTEEDKDGEVHRTSAYAHNALNVHPTRRVTHMWVAGVAVPDVQMAEYIKKERGPNSDAKAWQSSRPSLGQRRSRRWVDMVPRAGTVTSVEVYALWQSLLQQQQGSDATMQLRAGPAELTIRTMHNLISQYVQRHAEVSTSLVGASGMSSTPSESAMATESSTMRFDIHETLYPYGDAVLEVWVSEAQRLCRYIKATEVIATLHAKSSSTGVSNVHLTVHWDDGLLFTCTGGSGRQDCSSMVPPIDLTLTTCNAVFQWRDGESRIRLRHYPNTSSSTTAAAAVALKELSGQPTATLPQGGIIETCAALLEERVTLYCVHHCPTEFTAATSVELEASSEKETSCEVDERTGVVHRFYASGMQQLLFPSGATMVRRPLKPVVAKSAAPKSASQYCDTLVTLDGRCFVRNGSGTGDTSANAPAAGSKTVQPSAFQRVQVRIARANSKGMKSGTGAHDAQAPPFIHTEITYDAVHHCYMRSRQDGLTVAEYESLASYSETNAKKNGGRAGAVLARVVVFPDGTTITTVAPREARRRALVRRPDGTSASASLSSPTLCALLEELQAVEDSLFGAADDAAELSVRWCVEASTMPRVYLAPAPVGSSEEARECEALFVAVFGDGTVLQRRWAAAPTLPAAFSTVGTEAKAGEDDGLEGGEVGEGGAHSAPAYRGGSFETVLARPSTSAVRVLHQHAIATIEPADVLATITHASPAAYAVGQGLLFFDLACGGGMRMVDGARCVWEVRGLAEANDAPQVLHPERPSTYEELLRALVSPHYSPHRLPRAAQLMYAREQRRETAAYARQRAAGWCPSLLRRMREIAEPFIRTAQLLRTDVLAPIETAAAAAEERAFSACSAPDTDPSTAVKGGATAAARTGSSSTGIAPQCMSRVLPICFGQLDNGEAIRYWHVSEVLSSLSESCASSTPAAASEPHVIQRLVPGIATDSVLGYISTAPGHAYGADAIGVLLCGHPAATSGYRGVLWQRLATVTRLSLLFSGVLAPAIPPAIRRPLPASFASGAPSPAPESSSAYTTSLPPLAVLLSHGSRWLPPTLQPPQQFGAYQRKRPAVGAGTEVEYADVAWVRDSTAALSNAAASTAYVQYVLDQVNPFTALRTSRAALQREVARRELYRHEQLAQLSHYHRVLSSQWPMETPAAAREEQVRLEMRFEELQRGLQSAAPSPATVSCLPLPSAIGGPGKSERMVV